MVTLEELEKLSAHLGVTLKIDKTRNGRIWASKNNGHITLSNKNFNTMSQEGANNKTTCTVDQDVLSFHVQLQHLITQARSIHNDFQAIHGTFPELHLLNDTCFQGNSFETLMGLSLAKHEQCLSKKQLKSRKQRSILGALIGDSALINQLSSNMQQALHIQGENLAKIKDLDQSIVSHVNTLLETRSPTTKIYAQYFT